MQFEGLFAILLTMATALERLIEVIKPLYLQIKNEFSRIKYQECSKTEKIIMSIILGPVLCILARVGIDIPKVDELPFVQYIFAGLIISLGSNCLHSLLSIIIAVKNAAEGTRKQADRE